VTTQAESLSDIAIALEWLKEEAGNHNALVEQQNKILERIADCLWGLVSGPGTKYMNEP
jgi:hypothetical protein